METWLLIVIIAVAFIVIVFFFSFVPVRLWIAARASGVKLKNHLSGGHATEKNTPGQNRQSAY